MRAISEKKKKKKWLIHTAGERYTDAFAAVRFTPLHFSNQSLVGCLALIKQKSNWFFLRARAEQTYLTES